MNERRTEAFREEVDELLMRWVTDLEDATPEELRDVFMGAVNHFCYPDPIEAKVRNLSYHVDKLLDHSRVEDISLGGRFQIGVQLLLMNAYHRSPDELPYGTAVQEALDAVDQYYLGDVTDRD